MLAAPLGGGEEVVAHRPQYGLGGIQKMLGDGADLGRSLRRSERGQVGGEVRAGQGRVRQRMLREERLGVPLCPPE
ncbi:hypothetical protein A4V12_10115 [Streptomyces noursei]|nr:hypothetical protein A4V12_10115 [Streptomyces noursei]